MVKFECFVHTFHVDWLAPLDCGNHHVSVAFYFFFHVAPLRLALLHTFRRLVCVHAMLATDIVDRIRFYAILFPKYWRRIPEIIKCNVNKNKSINSVKVKLWNVFLTSFSFSISLNCLTRVSSGTRARSLAARTSASIAASFPISFFLSPVGLVAFAAGVAVAAAGVFVVSAAVVSASLGFLFGTSFSPLDSDSDRFVAAVAVSSVVVVAAASGAVKVGQY